MSLEDFAFNRIAAVSIDGRQVGLAFIILRLARCLCMVLKWFSQADSCSTSHSEIPLTLGHANRMVPMDLPHLGMESKVW